MLGEILKDLREQKGVTQDYMATLLCIKRQSYSAYERNVSCPDASTLKILADFFCVSADYLLATNYSTSVSKGGSLSNDQQGILDLYDKLDTEDKAEIRGEIKGMLRHEKYATLKPSQRHA